MTRTGSCNRCGECCKWVGFFLDPDDTRGLEWARVRGLRVLPRGGVLIKNRCPHLLAGNRCDLHGPNKPENCQVFPAQPRELMPGCGFGFVEDE